MKTEGFIHYFTDAVCTKVGHAGGKGASLARLTQAGFPVPPGFVVRAEAFERFLKERKLVSAIESEFMRVNHKYINSVDRASSVIRKMILEETVPEDIQDEIWQAFQKLWRGRKVLVAVRSSATAEDSKAASWAGELETYLNVTGKDLLSSVKNCWASLYTPRAIFYRFEKGLRQQNVSVAVVVQAMIESEVSGVCFTVHPVTRDKDQMVIEACFGLGEALVSGQITPDTYVIHKKDYSLSEINVSEQEFAIVRGMKGNVKKKLPRAESSAQKLSEGQIKALAQLCKKIEQHYHHPQDIEWAYAQGKLYILQSRPITTL